MNNSPFHPRPHGRQFETAIPCHQCGRPIVLVRECRTIRALCASCGATSPIQAYIHLVDDAAEEWLSYAMCDRV